MTPSLLIDTCCQSPSLPSWWRGRGRRADLQSLFRAWKIIRSSGSVTWSQLLPSPELVNSGCLDVNSTCVTISPVPFNIDPGSELVDAADCDSLSPSVSSWRSSSGLYKSTTSSFIHLYFLLAILRTFIHNWKDPVSRFDIKRKFLEFILVIARLAVGARGLQNSNWRPLVFIVQELLESTCTPTKLEGSLATTIWPSNRNAVFWISIILISL